MDSIEYVEILEIDLIRGIKYNSIKEKIRK
jgi:hypothetical protein